ncbi:MAG: hypothetical protein IPN08_06970 [Bacteroidales bacterium]|nr:hypothetical protein [Bacteroidales bacterium]
MLVHILSHLHSIAAGRLLMCTSGKVEFYQWIRLWKSASEGKMRTTNVPSGRGRGGPGGVGILYLPLRRAALMARQSRILSMDKVVEVRIRKACLALLRRANRQVGSPHVAGKMRANFYKAVEVRI